MEFEALHSAASVPISIRMRLAVLLLAAVPGWCAGPDSTARAEAAAAQRRSIQTMRAAIATQRAAIARMQMVLVVPPATVYASRNCAALPPQRVNALVQAAGEKQGLAPRLLEAVIAQESANYSCAQSSKGAMGLMQLMPSTALELEVNDPFDPKENVDAGGRYLKQLLIRYGGDLALALGAYNAGPGRVDEAGGLPQIPETMNYVNGILNRLAAGPSDTR
jgi:soluble lytic murein transglycosylase-like protein